MIYRACDIAGDGKENNHASSLLALLPQSGTQLRWSDTTTILSVFCTKREGIAKKRIGMVAVMTIERLQKEENPLML